MAIRFIIDSASDLPVAKAKELGVIHVPLKVTIDGVEYRDAVDMTTDEFYKKLAECEELPKTSQVGPAEFGDAIKEVLDAGDTPFIITVSSVLSGTYQSACIAASEYDDDQVYVVDSRSVSLGERILLERALDLNAQGMDAATIADTLNTEKKSMKLTAGLDTLEYLKKGGRISPAVAFAGGVLSIRPVIALVDGAIELVGKARGSKNLNNLLRNLIQESNGVDFSRPICVAYSGSDDTMLKNYINDNADLWQADAETLPITVVGSVIGTHVGPGAIAVAFFEKQ